ncbi:HlyD family efflux transporter periplasmic adaptor subunit [Psychrobacillus soli]|uniref:HlyD family efflux transporter periplasmic adaptor subunit n=1 Tax=Psychrobacillus soli TaxID=1543965 RepID=A0A544TG59_9BACI|nr:HlyD family efflux transporter periplasmic adaptor subunit [Psychrobacillus soli]TQR16429.1 HlyD family efflux transporter periplasmic adaptor subunit [Psychrobacillus soli]
MKKWIIISAIIVVIGGVSGWFFLGKKDQAQSVAAVAQTTTVQKGNLEVAVSGSGSVTAITDQDITVENTILVVDSVSVASRDTVYKGETLITFNNGLVVKAPYAGEITEVNVESGNGATRGAILLRIEDEDGIISPITRGDNNTSDSLSGGSSLTVDTVSVKEGDVVEQGATLVTFTDGSILQTELAGTITSLSVANGDSVQGSAIVAHITNYSSLQTTISVDELDITKVQVGQLVTITASAFEDETFAGEVTKVANEGISSNGVSTFDVTVQITDPKSLKIGMSTEASITIESKEEALYVPVEAVYKSGDEKYVLALATSGDSTQSAKKVTVETGISNDTYVEITSGLAEGESIQIPIVQSSGNSSLGGMMMPNSGFQGGGGFPSGDFGGRNGGGSPSFGGGAPSGGRGGN